MFVFCLCLLALSPGDGLPDVRLCGAAPAAPQQGPRRLGGGTGDCNDGLTVLDPAYEAGYMLRIPVVWHIIENTAGNGRTPEAQIAAQMEVLDQDFNALPGTPGELGAPARISFYMASVDPDGNPTTGITRTVHDAWYENQPGFKAALAWDPERYLNIFTNSAGGLLGYAFAPSGGGIAGTDNDGIVMYWHVVGRDDPVVGPFDQGRMGTHLAGHFLGLYHTYTTTCCNGLDCGDLIADTAAQNESTLACIDGMSCGTPDSLENYLDNTYDACMTGFTAQQVQRMRCTLFHFRPKLWRYDWDHPCGRDDTGTVRTLWRTPDTHYDYNGDGLVDVADLITRQNQNCPY